MKKILSVKNLSKTYQTSDCEVCAIKNISFDVEEGDFISIIGPSGCGKSTILSLLSGLINKSSGTIDYSNLSFSYMLQEDCLLPYLNVFDNCIIGLKIKKIENIENKNYVLKLLDKYKLKDFIYKFPYELSGGMKQRVALIRTLSIKPDILLLDEPLSALDYQSRISIGKDIYNIIKEERKTVIMVTHDINEAISFSNKIIVLTNRPSTIKKIYYLDDSIHDKSNSKYNELFNSIWEDLN